MGNHDKGKAWEMAVAKVTRHALDKAAQRNKSSHRGVRRSDIYTELPLHIEAKDQEAIKLKEWFRQSQSAAPMHKTPIVVWRMGEEMMVTLRYTDLLNFMVQIADLEAENADLRLPAEPPEMVPADTEDEMGAGVQGRETVYKCKAGHLADRYNYCFQRDCKFSRTYKVKKEKKK